MKILLGTRLIAIILSFLCATTSSFVSLILKKYSGYGALNANLIRLTATSIFFIILSIPYIASPNVFIEVFPVLAWLIIAIIVGLAIGDTLYIKSLQYIEISRATAIASVYPLFIGFWGYFAGEDITIYRLTGIFMIIISIWLSTNFSFRKIPEKGVVYALATAIAWSIGIILVRLYIDDLNIIVANALRYPFVIPFMLIKYFLDKGDKNRIFNVSRRALGMLILSGGLTVVSNIMLVYSLQIAEASLVSPIVATQPIQTSILAYILMREKISLRVVISIILLTFGTIVLL